MTPAVPDELARAAFDAAPVGMVMVDADRRLIDVNRAFAAFVGRGRDELLGVDLAVITHPDDVEASRTLVAELLRGDRERLEIVKRYVRPDGAVVWGRTTATRVAGADGRLHSVATVEDVTDERQTGRRLQRLRQQLDASLERQRSADAEHRHLEQLQGLAEALVAINSQRSLDEMLSAITEHARAIIGARAGSCSLTRAGTGAAEGWPQDAITVSMSEEYAAYRDYDRPSQGSPLYGLVCDGNHVVRLTDEQLRSHPSWRDLGPERGAHPPLRGWLAAPLVARDGSNLGILQLTDKVDGDFTGQDETLLVQLAQMASVGVEKARLQQQLEQRLIQLQGLAEVALRINSPLGVEQMLEQVTEAAATLVGAHQSVTTLVEDGDWRSAITRVHLSPEYAEWRDYAPRLTGDGIHALVCRENRTVRLRQDEIDAHSDWRRFGDAPDQPPLQGWLAAPLVSSDGRNLGLIQLSHKRDESDFAPEDEAILEQLAQMASGAIEKVRLYESQAAQSAARFRDELLAGVSHDMQTPLAVVVGIIDSLTEDPHLPAEERVRIYETVARQARRLRSLVNQFLDFSRLEAERPLVVDAEPTDVVAAIDAVVPLFAHQREIIVGADEHLPLALADRERLEQVLVNLVSNAVKYSTGPVRAVARVDGGAVVIDVVDEGPGLSEQELEAVFAKFQRGRTAHGTRGTGLGLYISRALTEAMGGRLTASSQEGLGCRFRVTLPVAAP